MNIKRCYALVLKCISSVAGIKNAKKFDSALRFHRKLNLKKPKTLADKVCFLELVDQSPLAPTCTDKFTVREYVASKGLENILVGLVGGPWNTPDEVNFDLLPERFALKATHGCKMNLIVTDKSQINVADSKKAMQKWLDTTYGTYSVEPHYAPIPHRLYAEEFLENANSLIDYKFHCMNGEPKFVLVCSDRKANGDKGMGVTLDLFNMNWEPLDGLQRIGNEIPGNGTVKKPQLFEQMKEIAKMLSADFKFVRVDLYEKDGKILFGELTFSPACGVFPYFTDTFNEEMGKLLQI